MPNVTLLKNEQRHVSVHSILSIRRSVRIQLALASDLMTGHTGALRPCSFRGVYGLRTAAIMYVSVDGSRKVNSDSCLLHPRRHGVHGKSIVEVFASSFSTAEPIFLLKHDQFRRPNSESAVFQSKVSSLNLTRI